VGLFYLLNQDEPTKGLTGTAGNRPEQDTLPINIKLSGTLARSEDDVFFLDEVPLEFAEGDNLPTAGILIRVEGQLLDDGTILVETWQPTEEEPAYRNCPADPCQPILSILSETYDLDYSALEAYLLEDLAIGELARLVAIAHHSDADLEDLIAQHGEGASWKDILKPYPAIPPIQLEP
jgi:hypothetical protein